MDLVILIYGSGLTWNDTLKPYTISLSGEILFDGKNNTIKLENFLVGKD